MVISGWPKNKFEPYDRLFCHIGKLLLFKIFFCFPSRNQAISQAQFKLFFKPKSNSLSLVQAQFTTAG
jgi:hypothetical protein